MKLFVVLGVWLIEFVIATNAGVSMNNPFYCYAIDPIRSATIMQSSWTSYEAIRRFNLAINPAISTCTPSRFWYVGRDGGRYPSVTNVPNMIDLAASSIQADIVANYEAGRTTLCRQDFEAIRDWTLPPNFTIQNANLATEASVIAMQNIARRYQQLFPNILNETYSPNLFHFRHNSAERTNTSIRAFASGLFGDSGSQNVIYEDIPENDWFLRPFDLCRERRDEWVGENDRREAFERGPEIEVMMQEVNRKLGFHGSNQLSFYTIAYLKRWCSFETSSGFELSDSPIGPEAPWCAAFSVAHSALVEYIEDLFRFYRSGYGFPNQRLLENLHCGLMQDLLTYMQSNDSTDQIARIFINSEEIQPLLVILGAFRDTWPLHEHNFAQQSGRLFAPSIISPIGSNLAIVRYDCDDGDHDIVFLLNERHLLVPGCDPQSGVCKLSFILNRFQRFIDDDCEAIFCTDN